MGFLDQTLKVFSAKLRVPQLFIEGTEKFSITNSSVYQRVGFVQPYKYNQIIIRTPGLYLVEVCFAFAPTDFPPEFPGYSIFAQMPGQKAIVVSSGSVSTNTSPDTITVSKSLQIRKSTVLSFQFTTQFAGRLTEGSGFTLILT